MQCHLSPAPGTFSDGSGHFCVGEWNKAWVEIHGWRASRERDLQSAFTSRSSLFQYPATGTELSRKAEIKVDMTLGAKIHSFFVNGKTVKSREVKNPYFFHLTWTAISQPYYWQNKHWLAEQCLHPLSPGLVAIVTCLGDECDILDSREKDFDSTGTSPEAQSWPQRCDCTFVHFPGTAWVIGGMVFGRDTETWWSVIIATLYLAVFRWRIHWNHWGKMNPKRAVNLQPKAIWANGGQFMCASSVTINWLVIAF